MSFRLTGTSRRTPICVLSCVLSVSVCVVCLFVIVAETDIYFEVIVRALILYYERAIMAWNATSTRKHVTCESLPSPLTPRCRLLLPVPVASRYFGVLIRDFAEISAEAMASYIGVSHPCQHHIGSTQSPVVCHPVAGSVSSSRR